MDRYRMQNKGIEKTGGKYYASILKLNLPYTIERDRKGSYMVTDLNEEEFEELVED